MKRIKELRITKTGCASVSIVFILIAEICFYKSYTIGLYHVVVLLGLLSALLGGVLRDEKYSREILLCDKKRTFLVWVVLVYIMYFIYGIFLKRSNTFSWDSLLLRLMENIALYASFRLLLLKNNTKQLYRVLTIISLSAILYLIINEGAAIIANSVRIGSKLSDNVNTVGFNMGLLATFYLWFYLSNKNKNKKSLLMYIVLMALGLFTGSKKVLLILVVDIIMYLIMSRKGLNKWIMALIIMVLMAFGLFAVPAIYNVIGKRVESMYSTMFVEDYSSSEYSYSTDMREKMIDEGISLIPEHPLFGGGWGYFASRTMTGYDYSHNNFIEILCSFGLFGFLLYYSLLMKDVVDLVKYRKDRRNNPGGIVELSISLIIIICLMDWTAITFSAQCVWYIPIMISTILIQKYRRIINSKGE